MQLPGHVAITLAEHRLLTLAEADQIPLPPMLLAGVFPDVIDKSMSYVFHLMPNGRHYAHNLFALLGLWLAVTLVWGKAVGWAWFWGYLGHLLADSGGFVPWFFPAKRYQFYPGRLRFKSSQMAKEMFFLAVVLLICHIPVKS
jgi:hypothetical protein